MSTFTQSISDSLWCFDDDNPEDALAFLNNPENFRSFSQGLTELMRKCSRDVPDDIDQKAAFLCAKLKAIGVSKTQNAIKEWFQDTHRPGFASNSRIMMFQVCFALHASYENVKWFFQHVYFDRCFNCHTIKEAVYYYCFANGLGYEHAGKLLQTIDSFPAAERSDETGILVTREIRSRLDNCSSDQALLNFLKKNKGMFRQWNTTASEAIRRYLAEIRGNKDDYKYKELIIKGKDVSPKDLCKCSLIIQELLTYKDRESLDTISGKTITSIDFMLDCIFDTPHRVHKDALIPDIVRKNFPSKMVFSEILHKIDTLTCYDSIRKCLILLKFYSFWCPIHAKQLKKLGIDGTAYDIYREETDHLLTCCGYETLFAGNPYDWLFLRSSITEDPLDFFREVLNLAIFP